MKYHINDKGNLVITADPEEQQKLQEDRGVSTAENSNWHSSDNEASVLETLIANSELDWLPEGSTPGDLTSAPMLGIWGEEFGVGWSSGGPWEVYTKPSLGFILTGGGAGHNTFVPIIARWAYMSYQVRSFLDDLADNGESVWEGGYADGVIRPTKPDTITIYSSNGELKVDRETGFVYPADSDYYGLPELTNIQRFNLEENMMFWGDEAHDGDILDFGYWTHDGFYEPPAMDWRFEHALVETTFYEIEFDEIYRESYTIQEIVALAMLKRHLGDMAKEPQLRTHE